MSTSILGAVTRVRSAAASTLGRGLTMAEEQYAKTMKENAKYVVKDPNQEKVLLQQWVYTKLSKIPATSLEVQSEYKELTTFWAKRGDFSLKEVGTGVMFAAEVFGWFCVGEIIGRGGSLLGYNV